MRRKSFLSKCSPGFLLSFFLLISASAQEISFDQYFQDQALRLDLYQVGEAKEEFITVNRLYLEPIWPESRKYLIQPFNYGRYLIKLYDVASNQLIFCRGFESVFGEYRTTSPALAGIKKVMERSIRIPFPKKPVYLVIEKRNRKNIPYPFFEMTIDPMDYHIIRESPSFGDVIIEKQKTGSPHQKVDLVFIAEGYLAEDLDKFKADLDRFTDYLFKIEPYNRYREDFNIYGIFRPSPERAVDEPRQRVYKKTNLNASFNAFDLDRYMLIDDNHRLRAMAAQVPYDTIVVLVNSARYGGGGIGFDYCVTTTDHPSSLQVFIHEFGHSFAYLADEYYQSEVAYNEFYPQGVEPLEPNITALLDPTNIKWKKLLSPSISIPTEYGKEKIEAFQAERRTLRQRQMEEINEAKKKGEPEIKIKLIQDKYQAKEKEILAKIEAIRKEFAHLIDKVGAFEGAGYASKGLYRPQIYCLMGSTQKGEFCQVCQWAIKQIIDFYCDR
ncbi:MAG: IgA Peptidase M64 [Candidatus Aminicenantes bacterium]|nr:IgA Peptidase M64 [Candidatus Aminicenantes bacterium]